METPEFQCGHCGVVTDDPFDDHCDECGDSMCAFCRDIHDENGGVCPLRENSWVSKLYEEEEDGQPEP